MISTRYNYLAARLSKLPPKELAGLFDRDRVTVRTGILRIETLVKKDRALAAHITRLEASLRVVRSAP
jgi:hypothetical protein